MAPVTLSLVIPAFNEAETIGGLLASLRTESADLDEIIVVDNASTDDTVRVVQQFGDLPQLRIVREDRPGVIAARNAGFDAATGEVIGRLDADSRARPGWARAVRDFFAGADPDVGAGSGYFDQYDMPLARVHEAMMRANFRTAQRAGGELASLFGANMAIRRSTWERIRPLLLDVSGIFDDLDITLCVQDIGQHSAYVPGMDSSASGRRMLSDRRTYWKFTAYLPATYTARGMTEEARRARGSVWFMRAMHLVLWVPSHAWDPDAQRYSWRRLIGRHEQRVLPYS